MSSCIADVGAWMASNRLRLNPTKTVLILLGSPRRVVNITLGSVRIDEVEIPLSPLVRDLGVYIDSGLSLKDHVDKTVRLAFFHLRQLRLIRRSLPQDAMHSLVRALVHSRLDYCNSILANGPSGLLGQLQSVLRAAARPVLRLPARSQGSDLMREKLHWLDIKQPSNVQVVRHRIQVSTRTLPRLFVFDVRFIPFDSWQSVPSIINRFHSSGPEGIHKILRHAWFLLRMSIHLEQSSASSETGTPEPMGQGWQLPPLPILAGGQGGQRCLFPKI